MGEPNGGLSDSTPPEIIIQRTAPPNKSVNFEADKIVIQFNEFINLKSQSVVITPALSKKPEIKSRGKKVEINFTEKPEPNTTYTINLSGAVADITEGNTVENLLYVFSTGPYLDSLSISGRVLNAFGQNGVGSTTVILHKAENDSAIYNEKPAYFLKTAKDGTFKLSNLKQGNYNLYALNDKNADLMYNGYPEEIAFLDSAIVLGTKNKPVVLNQFKPAGKKLRQTSSAFASKWMQVYRYNRLLKDIAVEPLNERFAGKFASHKNFASDSVFYVMMKDTSITDTVMLKVTENGSPIDTIKFTAHRSKKMSSKASFRLIAPVEYYVTDSIFIATNAPPTVNKELISITDTLHKKPVSFTIVTSVFGVKIIPQKQTEKIPMRVVCLPGAVTSTITATSNDTLKNTSIVFPVEKMGSIQLTLKDMDAFSFTNPVCVLLMEGKYLRKQVLSLNKPVINFELLKPGNYSFYVFNDDNNDGIWSPGDLDTKKQAEKIKWYTQPVKVKANWTQDLTWIF